MQQTIEQQTIEGQPAGFVERRQAPGEDLPPGMERRQFSNAYNSLRPEVNELAEAIDRYKLRHRRRFITFEELYDVICELGYRRS